MGYVCMRWTKLNFLLDAENFQHLLLLLILAKFNLYSVRTFEIGANPVSSQQFLLAYKYDFGF